MRTETNFDREFIKWFYEEDYPAAGSNRAEVVKRATNTHIDIVDKFMRECYKQGAKTMAQDVSDTLAQYACAVEGLDPEMITPAEIYDRARENLHYYTNRVLNNA